MQTNTLRLHWPNSAKEKHSIYPIFIPFAGCPQRCIFCAQQMQSGQKLHAITHILQQAQLNISQRQSQGLPPLEIAFYGGTFTALPEQDLALCLDFTHTLYAKGAIAGARCSTRPDAIDTAKLTTLARAHFSTIELGVQSFDNTALHLAKRHYSESHVLAACQAIKQAGFRLGIQLMPGMPGVSETIFLADAQKALAQQADFLRFYPCQVIAGTELEKLWRQNAFTPWTLPQTLSALSQAWLWAHLQQVPVIRMGLAPQPELESHILAGPRHAALGNLVQSEGIYRHIAQKLTLHQKTQGQMTFTSPQRIFLPKSCQGYFWGHGQSLVPRWKNLGISQECIQWHEEQYIDIKL